VSTFFDFTAMPAPEPVAEAASESTAEFGHAAKLAVPQVFDDENLTWKPTRASNVEDMEPIGGEYEPTDPTAVRIADYAPEGWELPPLLSPEEDSIIEKILSEYDPRVLLRHYGV
jgi:hypothetical protein